MTPKYHHYHNPPPAVSTRVRCPVCHEEVYSPAGIHPQCAVRQCDPPRVKDKGQKAPSPIEPVSTTPAQPCCDVVDALSTAEKDPRS